MSSPRRRPFPLGSARVLGVAFAVLISLGASAAEPVPGRSVEELLEVARKMNPELTARALESDAAAAKAAAASSLDDPVLRVTSDDDRDAAGNRLNKMIYGIEQEFPLWGKRDLRREVAQAEAVGVRGKEAAARLELESRVKTAYAQYWRATEAIRVTHEVHGLLQGVAGAAQARYGQGLGTQSDAIRSDVERARLDLDFAALERDRRSARARLNALLARPAGAPLADPLGLRPLPPAASTQIEALLDRARGRNPAVSVATAEIDAAEGSRKLVERSWYPDVTIGAGAIQREDGPAGFTASIGVRIPLQWGLREAQTREAIARRGAARSRLDAALLEIQSALEEAVAGLDAARRNEELLATSLTPQTQAAYRSAIASYQQGRGDLTAVLEAARRVRDVRLELLKTRAEEQSLLADIERIIGGEL